MYGDFDSVNKNILSKYKELTNIHKFNSEKDYTDTDIAIKLAVELDATEIIIIGGIGTRLDHTIANVQSMRTAIKNNIKCKMIDQNNEIMLINKKTRIDASRYSYISILPLTTEVTGITLKGFKYLLDNKTLKTGESIGVSNEQIEKYGIIELKQGILIVIKARD